MAEGKQTQINDSAKKQFQSQLDVPAILPTYVGTGKLKGKVALITGGDSGIGRAVAVHFAREGADVGIAYLESDGDAKTTKQMVQHEGVHCLLLKGDVSKERTCKSMVNKMIKQFGGIDILVNNAGTHEEDENVQGISPAQLSRTFEVNIFSMFYLTQAALEHMKAKGAIINTASVTAYRGSEHLVDYSATKGAIVTFTRSLAKNLAARQIRVNAVAPGPVWTPLVVYSFDKKKLRDFGKDTPLGRAGYPHEFGPAYVYLASADSSYMTGQVMHINGGDFVNS
ncbi:MAG: glucose 1-dehydrogenase [Bacteroidetes bacterium]|nr:glucose 1-dehydrogenase [Bacteroidota bacterium]